MHGFASHGLSSEEREAGGLAEKQKGNPVAVNRAESEEHVAKRGGGTNY